LFDVLRRVHSLADDSAALNTPASLLTVLESITRPGDDPRGQLRHLERMPDETLSRFLRVDQRRAAVALHSPDIGAARLAPDFERADQQLAQIEMEYPGYRLHLTGTMVVAARNVYQMIGDLARSLTLAGVIIFGMMAVLFRSLLLAALSIVPNVFPQAITASLLVWFDEPLRMTSVLTFSLCLGLSVDDTVHFLMRFRRERAAGLKLRAAILRSFDTVGGVMVTTSLVLIGGFLAMTVSRMPGVRTFAVLSTVTLLAAIVGDLVMLPALLLTFPLRRKKARAPEPAELAA
jgi:predicted RND superfamily exporter protein